MDYTYEIVKLEHDLPIKLIIHQGIDPVFFPRHWHESIEISYVLSGDIDNIYIDGINYTSTQGDIVLINSNSVHSFYVDYGEKRKAATLFISYDFLKENYKKMEGITFDCISINEKDEKKLKEFQRLRKILDDIIDAFLDKEKNPLALLKIRSLSFELIYCLLSNFKGSQSTNTRVPTKKYLARLNHITSFINENYDQILSLHLLANQFNISSEYLSRFFKEYMGVTVLSYINSIRLEKAYRDLINSDLPIMELALKHGFPNEKSFYRVFREKYNLSPNQYRKKYTSGRL